MTFAPSMLLAAAALALTTTALASGGESPLQPGKTCRRPNYPAEALRRDEHGVALIGFLVGVDGQVIRSLVLNSSGSDELDRETALALSKCVFKPSVKEDKPIEAWQAVPYWWVVEDDEGSKRAIRKAAIAAKQGNAAAYYQLSLLLGRVAKPTPEDRQRAFATLLKAAQLGDSHAQFDLGRHLEKGEDVAANPQEALDWYAKAAAQADPFAVQRLAMGVLLEAP